MIKGCALVGIMLILSGGMVGARLPQVGDFVGIIADRGLGSNVYIGTITDLSENFVTLNCSEIHIQGEENVTSEEEICLSIAYIRELRWGNSSKVSGGG